MTDQFIKLSLTRKEADFLAALLGHHILGIAPESEDIYNRLADHYDSHDLAFPKPLVTSPIPAHPYSDRQMICVNRL